MRVLRGAIAAVSTLAIAVGLSGCAMPSRVASGSTVTVAVDAPFTSANPATSFGATSVNSAVGHLTGSGFGYIDDDLATVSDEWFGRAEIVESSPFTVRYSVADDSEWSDGVAVDGADLLLSWAAQSHALDTYAADSEEADVSTFLDPATGRVVDTVPADVVYFDGIPTPGLDAGSEAVVDGGGRSVTVEFDGYFPGWQLAIQPGIPAHVLAGRADPELVGDPSRAKAAVIDAIRAGEGERLAALSRHWTGDWNFTGMPEQPELLVSSGPYVVEDIVAGQSVTLVANPRYGGARQPVIERLVLRTAASPAEAVALVQSGEVDVAMPQPSADIVAQVSDAEGLTVEAGVRSELEMLQFKAVDGLTPTMGDVHARRAFLMAVPREELVDTLVGAVDEDAQALDSFIFQPRTDAYAAAARDNGSGDLDFVDLEGARAELARSRVADPSVCILFDPADPRRTRAFELIRESATDAGFDVTSCATPEWRSVLGTPGAYDAALVAVPTVGGVTAVEAEYLSTSPRNTSGYASDTVDELIAEYRSTTDAERRASLLAQIDRELWTDAVGIPLFAAPSLTVIGPRVEGVVASSAPFGALSSAWDWTLAPEPDLETGTGETGTPPDGE